MSGAASVELRGLHHLYGETVALSDVSLSLPAGATIGLIGPDGVGKSTLLGLIAGVKRIQAGEVGVLGADLRDRKRREALLPRIAYMPQGLGRNLYPTLSVVENIDFFARLFGLPAAERESRIRRLLSATGLAPFPDRRAGKLSGGMKQKLGLCCALVHDPDLLILDEPTTGVDPLSRRQFWTLVEELRAESGRMTVIVATAYMEEAARFDHLVAMEGGRVLASGATRDVLAGAGADSVEQAYLALLPGDKRGDEAAFVIPPYSDPGGAPAIEAVGLTRRFDDFVAVDSVSFRIGRGEIFGFLGSNGCGKSTTMKMLTGLLAASSGSARLLGAEIDAGDMRTRLRVGYMSQSFSLYEELTVRQNLVLHARLYRVAGSAAGALVEAALADFGLAEQADALPAGLPLGIRQRLQLAAACLHSPEVLILDEPTSGVDPVARDMFWRHLARLSRERHVTIFVSTHFMNEAERCDRISLMHRGRVLAVGAPAELARGRGGGSLEEAFIAYLAEAEGPPAPAPPAAPRAPRPAASGRAAGWLAHAWAFARREMLELIRDKARLSFALLGPMAVLCIAAYAVSFDIETIRFAVLDRDQTHASRDFIEAFSGSDYFREVAAPRGDAEAAALLRAGEAQLVIEMPPGFGRDLESGRRPEILFALDGSSPFIATNIRAYAAGTVLAYAGGLARSAPGAGLPVTVEPRFVYNQDFRSIHAMAPGVIMAALILIPAMLTALGVVREKEVGSITNLYASSATVGQYLIGKQLPYVGLAMASYLTLVALTVTLLGVPLKGSFLALSAGALLFVTATTALGLLMSAFARTQVAALFGTAILCMIHTMNFSGLLYPVSTLTGRAYWVGLGFPTSWFQLISLGAFTKGLGFASFVSFYAALAGFAALYLAAARLLLKKQEA